MGYSITTKFGSINEVKVMLDFLASVQPILDELEKTEQARFSFNFNTGSEVGVYAPKKERNLMISMDGTTIPYYAWAVSSWLSFQSTLRDKCNNPYLFYDSEVVPLYIRNSSEDIPSNGILLDSDGITCYDAEHFIKGSLLKLFNMGPDFTAQRKLMRELNDSWLQYKQHLSYSNNEHANFGV